jgi:hypothetical protein
VILNINKTLFTPAIQSLYHTTNSSQSQSKYIHDCYYNQVAVIYILLAVLLLSFFLALIISSLPTSVYNYRPTDAHLQLQRLIHQTVKNRRITRQMTTCLTKQQYLPANFKSQHNIRWFTIYTSNAILYEKHLVVKARIHDHNCNKAPIFQKIRDTTLKNTRFTKTKLSLKAQSQTFASNQIYIFLPLVTKLVPGSDLR